MTGRGYDDPRAGTNPVGSLPDRACVQPGVDPEIFFPDSGHEVHQAPALVVCRRCPHRDPCRDWAVETRQEFGIWGATTPEDRKAIVRKETS